MSIDLEKRAEKFRIVLEKRAIVQLPPIRVGAALDVTGSMRHLYLNGTMQEALTRLLAMALKLDDNGQLDVWTFEDSSSELESANRDNYESFVQTHILDNRKVSKWGGTSYAPVVRSITKTYFGPRKVAHTTQEIVEPSGFLGKLLGKPTVREHTVFEELPADNSPAMCLFLTDGANDDRRAAREALRVAKGFPLYWQMVGVGQYVNEFAFLQEMADELPNVGFVNLSDLGISDEKLYEQLVTDELTTWLKAR